MEVAGEAHDGREAVELAVRRRPDVLLLDIGMPGLDGVDASARIHAQAPSARLVMRSGGEDSADLTACVRAGATGYLLKSLHAEDIASVVRDAHEGRSPLARSMAGTLIEEISRLGCDSTPAAVAHPRALTRREIEVLQAISDGLSTRDVAHRLFISESTVQNHVRSILDKPQLRSRLDPVLQATRQGLIQLGAPPSA